MRESAKTKHGTAAYWDYHFPIRLRKMLLSAVLLLALKRTRRAPYVEHMPAIYQNTQSKSATRTKGETMCDEIQTCWRCGGKPVLNVVFIKFHPGQKESARYRYECHNCPLGPYSSFSKRDSEADALKQWNKGQKSVKSRKRNQESREQKLWRT